MSEPDPSPQLSSAFPSHRPPVAVSLVVTSDHQCAYSRERTSRTRAFWADRMPGPMYHRFMDAGFRRSGKVVYQPICAGCRACVPLRVPVARFNASKSQRRCWRRNQDLSVTIALAEATEEKFDLYERYRRGWHGAAEETGWEGFVSFFVQLAGGDAGLVLSG